MIPFEYRTPKNLKEVHSTLKEFGADAKLIAGGTALVIMMKQRLVRPTCLVSLGSVRGLNGIEVKDGGLSIGGLATHRAVEDSGACPCSPQPTTTWPPYVCATWRRSAAV